MKKHTLMVATAVAALTLGTSVGFAQAPHPGDSHMNPASKNAPAEKIAPSPGAGPNGAAGLQPKNVPSARMDQAPGSAQHMQRETTGQAPTEQPNAERPAPKTEKPNTAARPNEHNNAARPDEGNRAGQNSTQNRNGPNETRSNAASTNRSSANVNLTVEQKSKIHSIIVARSGGPRVAHVDFDVHVGVAVPRTVVLAPVPEGIVVIEPEWRGFEYFLVGDEIVVVDPATLEIVAVLPA
jgi:hypothetical protein